MLDRKKRRLFIIAAGSIFLFFSSNNLVAQTQYTVALPEVDIAVPSNKYLHIAASPEGKETARSLFLFDLNMLPQNAKVIKLTLKLYVSSRTDISITATQQVTLLKGDSKWADNLPISLTDPNIAWTDIKINKVTIGIDIVKKTSSSISLKLRIPEKPQYLAAFLPGGLLSISARSAQRGENNYFYSSAMAEASDKYLYKPKLIVQYEISPYPKRNDWAQTFNTAQHAGYLKWTTNSNLLVPGFQLLPHEKNELFVGADPTGAMLIFKNNPVVFTQSVSGTTVYFVKQLDVNGNVLWAQGVDNAAKCCPVIDEMGRLYYFSLSGTISILDMNNSGAFLSAGNITYKNIPVSSITKDRPETFVKGVTIGYDGTLYISTSQSNLAISAYPQLKIRWKYENTTKELTGPVSLSADESKAFFIRVNTQQGNSRLMVLNNMDGTIMDTSKPLDFSYSGQYMSLIPAPVVQGNSTIFVLSGFDNGRVLYRFSLNTTLNKLKTEVRRVEADAPLNTGISQPVADPSSHVYFVFKNKIACYDSTKINNTAVLESSPALDNSSILVTDGSSAIYALDPYATAGNNLFGFKYNTSRELKNNFAIRLHAGNLKKNLALATDGTLYTTTLNNLVAIVPVSVSQDDLTISKDNLSTNTLYRANKSISIDKLTVPGSINAVIYSGGSISFKPGFNVSQGAQLLFKTGFLK